MIWMLHWNTVKQLLHGHPRTIHLAGQLQSLAVSYSDRYYRLGNIDDLEAALENSKAAVALTPEGHPDLAGWFQSLAVSLTHRYQRLGNTNDLDAALENRKAAVAQTPEGHPDLAGQLQSPTVSYSHHYHRSGNIDDLQAALANNRAAAAQTPEGHPELAGRLESLALSFSNQYKRLGNINDLEAALTRYRLSFATPKSDVMGAWESALKWASLAALQMPTQVVSAYSAAFGLLPDLLWIGNSISVRLARSPFGHSLIVYN
jgi:hypothetical protein